jgi:hypothetical protein
METSENFKSYIMRDQQLKECKEILRYGLKGNLIIFYLIDIPFHIKSSESTLK